MQEWIDRAPGLFAVGTAGVLLLTVLHELGYFLIVGYQFQSFLSVSDYFANSIFWLPYLAVAFLLGLAWGEVTRPNNSGPGGLSLKAYLFIFIASGVLILIFDFLSGVAVLVAIGAATFFVRSLKRGEDADYKAPRWAIYLSLATPMVGALVFLSGVADARRDLRPTGAQAFLHLKFADADEEVTILRTFDRGVLAIGFASKQIEFFRWEEIQKISTPVPIEKSVWERRPMCRLYSSCK